MTFMETCSPTGRRNSTISIITRTSPLAEIAENYGITRQGVRDVIVRAEAYLTEIEDRTGLIRRFHTMQSQLREIADCVRQVTDLNDKRLGSDELEVLASRIQSLTDKLIQE